MSLATFFRRKRSQAPGRVGLREDVFRGLGKPRVDREKGILYETKILGWKSENDREYDPKGVCQCKGLYEGKPSDIDHTTKGNPHPESRTGWHENIQCKEDGLYSDFHFLNPETEFAKSVMNAAEKNPTLFGFSHDADGEPDPKNPNLIRRIIEVRSIDIVSRPATTSGLFESKGKAMKITMRKLLESHRNRFSKVRQGWMDKLLEDDNMPMDLDVEPAADADPDDVLADGFEQSCLAIVKAAIAGEVDVPEALAKLEQLLTTHDSLSADDEPAAVDAEEDEETDADKKKKEDDEEGDDKKDAKESRQNIKRREAVLDLCETLEFTPTKSVRKALIALNSDSERKALIEDYKKTGAGDKRRGPRSSAASDTTTLQESEVPKENGKLADWLRT